MRFIVASVVFFALNASTFASSNGFNPNELTYVVSMSVNEKTAAQIDDFSAFYNALVEGNEPGTLAWQFYRGADEKIYLIESLEAVGLPFEFRSTIGGYSRN